MKIKEKILEISSLFETAGIADSGLEAEAVLTLVLSRGRDFLYAYPEIELTKRQESRIKKVVKKRLKGFSLALISGHKEFYGFDFLVDKNVLIPRPETELMVDSVLEKIAANRLQTVDLIDVGTGSGCIAITLAKKLADLGVKNSVWGLDISRKALKVARKNSEKNNLYGCIKFLHSDLLKVIDFEKMKGPIFITANLPYLTPQQYKKSPTIKKEPKKALVSGVDGLGHYRRLFAQIKARIPRSKDRLVVFCEIDENQRHSFPALAEKFFPDVKIEIKKDLGGFERLATLVF